jgi:hypothetical protein
MPIPLSQFEIAPLPGQQPLPGGQSLDPVTGLYRCHLSVDPSGKVGSPIWGALASGIFTPTQLKAVHATPVTMVPAQGSGLLILPFWIMFNLQFKTTPYAGLGPFPVFYGNGPSDVLSEDLTDFFTSASSHVCQIPCGVTSAAPSNGDAVTTIANQPLVFTSSNAVELTDGDSPVSWSMLYNVVPVL